MADPPRPTSSPALLWMFVRSLMTSCTLTSDSIKAREISDIRALSASLVRASLASFDWSFWREDRSFPPSSARTMMVHVDGGALYLALLFFLGFIASRGNGQTTTSYNKQHDNDGALLLTTAPETLTISRTMTTNDNGEDGEDSLPPPTTVTTAERRRREERQCNNRLDVRHKKGVTSDKG